MVSKKSKINILFFIWENRTWYWEKRCLFSIGNGAEIQSLEWSLKKVNFFFSLFFIFENVTWYSEKGSYFRMGMGPKVGP